MLRPHAATWPNRRPAYHPVAYNPSVTPEEISDKLAAFLQRSHEAKAVRIANLRLLTGGASRQTWSFDAVIVYPKHRTDQLALVARCDPRKGPNSMSRETEYSVLAAAGAAGVPVPRVHLLGDDSLGVPFFLMDRVEGETIARRILRDDAFAGARPQMAAQLGRIAAAIHRIPIDTPGLESPAPAPSPGSQPPRPSSSASSRPTAPSRPSRTRPSSSPSAG